MERIVRDVWLTIPGECDIFNSKKCRQCMERIVSDVWQTIPGAPDIFSFHYRYNAGRLQILTCAARQTSKQMTSRNDRSSLFMHCSTKYICEHSTAWHHLKNPEIAIIAPRGRRARARGPYGAREASIVWRYSSIEFYS